MAIAPISWRDPYVERMDCMFARYYSSGLARFMETDPSITMHGSKMPQSWNRYAYGLSNPLRYMDLTGKEPSLFNLGSWVEYAQGWLHQIERYGTEMAAYEAKRKAAEEFVIKTRNTQDLQAGAAGFRMASAIQSTITSGDNEEDESEGVVVGSGLDVGADVLDTLDEGNKKAIVQDAHDSGELDVGPEPPFPNPFSELGWFFPYHSSVPSEDSGFSLLPGTAQLHNMMQLANKEQERQDCELWYFLHFM